MIKAPSAGNKECCPIKNSSLPSGNKYERSAIDSSCSNNSGMVTKRGNNGFGIGATRRVSR